MAADPFHERLLTMVLRLPGAYEDRPWGEVHCKVADKIFIGWGRSDDGGMTIGFKTDKELQAMLVASDPRFTVAAYVGKHGWVNMKLGPSPDWSEVEQFIVQSYRMIAPKKLVKELDARDGASAAPAPRAAPGRTGAKKAVEVRAKATKPAKVAKPAKPAKSAKTAKRAAAR